MVAAAGRLGWEALRTPPGVGAARGLNAMRREFFFVTDGVGGKVTLKGQVGAIGKRG